MSGGGGSANIIRAGVLPTKSTLYTHHCRTELHKAI